MRGRRWFVGAFALACVTEQSAAATSERGYAEPRPEAPREETSGSGADATGSGAAGDRDAAATKNASDASGADDAAAADDASGAAVDDAAEPADAADEEREVEVRGSLRETSSRDPAAASTVLRGAQLEEPGVDLARVVARAPGVQITRSGVNAELSTLSLRGADSAQVPVYLAGIRLVDELTGVSDLSRVPLWMLDRIEIYRGSSPEFSPRFGMGGAVFLEPRLPRGGEARARAEFGSFGSASVGAGLAFATPEARGPERVRAATSLGYRFARADNDFTYEDDGGTAWDPSDDRRVVRRNADFSSHDVWSLSRFDVPTRRGPVRVDVLWSAFQREQGVTGISSIQALHSRADTARSVGGLTARVPCSAREPEGGQGCELEVSTRGVWQKQTTTDPRGELNLGADWIAQRAERIETRASLRLPWGSHARVGLDASGESGRVALDEPQHQRTRATERLGAVGAVLGARFDGLSALGIVRATCLDVDGTEAGSAARLEQCFFEGRAGAAYEHSRGHELRLNTSRAVRAPTLGERYGVSAGTRGNPELQAESGWNADVGALGAFELGPRFALGYEAFGFARWADDLIAYQRSSLGYVRPYNIASARTLGFELAAQADALRLARVRGSLTGLDPRDTSAGRAVTNDLVPLLSRLVVQGELELYRDFGAGAWNRASLTTYVSHRAGRVADPAGLIVIPAQTSVDVACAALLFDRTLALRARIENVFDARLFDLVGYPLPGRAFYFAGELLF